METTDLRYPIGKFSPPDPITREDVGEWIPSLAALPDALRQATYWMNDEQLDTPYRPGGWTVRQVVHHLPDSHLHCFLRFKWALTEDRPVIEAYDEGRWAALPDSREPVHDSLDLLEVRHQRWGTLLRGLTWERLQREFVHPDSGPVTLAATVGAYSWHGWHHLAHLERLTDREGWLD